MSGLLGPNGKPISSSYAKASPPPTKPLVPRWGGEDLQYYHLPGGGVLQFDLNRLTLDEYRSMRDHYQVNANLVTLTFMLHQVDWKVESSNKQQAQEIEDQIRAVWTRLIRGCSQAFWAGFSPCVLEYENDVDNRRVKLNKIKDLRPEDCRVHWKRVQGWAPPGSSASPNIPIYDGIREISNAFPYPVESTFWYPLLMENGNYYGKKLLRPAFAPWFFSQLLHLFSNRYYERFGEPVPIGRADYEDTIEMDGKTVSGLEAMQNVIRNLRNRSTVVLPSTREQVGGGGTGANKYEYVYNLEYLESQMRGADFERYMTRLDEEISLSLFTPILLLRTSDVGSYNLGTSHMQLWMWMLNALMGDMKEYIDRYIVTPIKNYNFGVNAPDAQWTFLPWGKANLETIRTIVGNLITGGTAAPDLEKLGEYIGLELHEVKLLQTDPTVDKPDPVGGGASKTNRPARPKGVDRTAKAVNERIRGQVDKAFKNGTFGTTFSPTLGFKHKFREELLSEGYDDAERRTNSLYATLDAGVAELIRSGGATGSEEFMDKFSTYLDVQVDRVIS